MTQQLTLAATHPPRSLYFFWGIAHHWKAIFLITFGVFNLLPFLAPVFMHLDWKPAGNAIYTVYSPLCHQTAQRSFFFFGPQVMYNVEELPVELSGNQAADTLILRRFRGSENTGWKVAWSDRMVFYLWRGLADGSNLCVFSTFPANETYFPLAFCIALATHSRRWHDTSYQRFRRVDKGISV